jgi:hypothetical protein
MGNSVMTEKGTEMKGYGDDRWVWGLETTCKGQEHNEELGGSPCLRNPPPGLAAILFQKSVRFIDTGPKAQSLYKAISHSSSSPAVPSLLYSRNHCTHPVSHRLNNHRDLRTLGQK